jgi:hypothetical protein
MEPFDYTLTSLARIERERNPDERRGLPRISFHSIRATLATLACLSCLPKLWSLNFIVGYTILVFGCIFRIARVARLLRLQLFRSKYACALHPLFVHA